MNQPRRYPTPTVKQPSISSLEKMLSDGICKATDGCRVEPDGTCPHGYPSWIMELGF